jgi:hypothetical protein
MQDQIESDVLNSPTIVLVPLAVCLLTVISVLTGDPQPWVRWAAWAIGLTACAVLTYTAFDRRLWTSKYRDERSPDEI